MGKSVLRPLFGLSITLISLSHFNLLWSVPNVLIIITDDQGYGDVGFHGNPIIRTPHLDRLAAESVEFRRFYVSPVCAPTRASLLTGRYNYRTGVVDTYLGRAMMHTDEVTLAEILASAGYRTGIFGKWHLGDNYPMRPIDQGFQESLVHKGGGIGQPSDPPGGESYFDPILQYNGKQVSAKGYCSDVFTEAAIKFIAGSEGKPFLAYLAYNCPHTPLQVPESYHTPYARLGISPSSFPAIGQPIPANAPQDATARIYGMVTNIDDNIGRLLAKLDELNLSSKTIVIFLADNGPQQPRYIGGLRGRKGGVHEGGIRVPFLIRAPGVGSPGRMIDRIAAHIDVVPTLLELCGVPKPRAVSFDGASLVPVLKGTENVSADRTLYLQWHRGDEPEPRRAFAAVSQRYKLVQPRGAGVEKMPENPLFELYDLIADPYEFNDLGRQHPDIVRRMLAGYDAWFKDVSGTRGYSPMRIRLGAPQENPVTLTRQDWRGRRAGWRPRDVGFWEVDVVTAGVYDVALKFAPPAGPATAQLRIGPVARKIKIAVRDGECRIASVRLPKGPGRLEAWLEEGKESYGVLYVEVSN